MSSSSSSCSPSSSAVTIPIPGKSILKRPPPPQHSLFSRITRFLPTQSQPASSTDDEKPLKRAHFILPQLTTVYPISSLNPPSTPTLKEEKRAIEERERERRRRVVRGNSISGSSMSTGKEGGGGGGGDEWWSLEKVESFYRECCAGCDEQPDPAISAAFKHGSSGHPRTVDFSGVQLNIVSASILSDVFTIEWGLRKLVFRECDLDEHILKPILHALLIPNSLSYLSVASNRRLKAPAFRLIAAFASQAKSLEFLDLSQNNLDKKSVEYIISSLTTASTPSMNTQSTSTTSTSTTNASLNNTAVSGLVSLRLDDCNLRHAALEILCRTVRTSSLKNISLRYNKINQTGAVALALMIRDYPDVIPAGMSVPTTPIPTPLASNHHYTPSLSSNLSTPNSSVPPSPASSTSGLPPLHTLPYHHHTQTLPPLSSSNFSTTTPTQSPLTSPTVTSSPTPPLRAGPVLPPPRHPPTGLQTTYTPYIPKSRRRPVPLTAQNPLSSTGQPVPIITSSSQGGVTARYPAPAPSASLGLGGSGAGDVQTGERDRGEKERQQQQQQQHSQALLDKVRALDALPRLGALRTLDLKGNDLRTGVSYVAQVLKRNRTLKVLNLSENKLDVPCLVHIAEALKYNSCLETLDLSKNPCCGPGLEGIQSLRTAFTLNTSLKRLFLSSTSLSSSGAIALAEFLPESSSLLHLDLTRNELDIASVMALRSGLRANWVMRCLDLDVPPGDEEFARMCRDILNSCIRNTEEAEKNAHQPVNGVNGAVGRNAGKGVWSMIEESELARSIRLGDETKGDGDVVSRAKAVIGQLRLDSTATKDSMAELTAQAKTILFELSGLIESMSEPSRMEELLGINDELTELLSRTSTTIPGKPSLKLTGLGFTITSAHSPSSTSVSNVTANGSAIMSNGSLHDSPIQEADKDEGEEEVTTPRIDKGKAKAEPEPEEPEKVLSPSVDFVIHEDDTDDEDVMRFVEAEEGEEDVTSPVIDRSRILVEEEGEVFRKGTVLLGPEEMEGDYAGEELRKELLEAMVERPPPRPLLDEYGLELNVHVPQQSPSSEAEQPTSPQATSPTEKPPPRPYISRRSSSSSIMSIISPTLPSSKGVNEGEAGGTVASPTIRSPTILSPSLPSLASPRPYAPRRGSAGSLEPTTN